MAKACKERLQELYDVVRDIDGVEPIDGRSSHISYVANVDVLTKIVKKITATYGGPTKNHPLLNNIEWRVRPDFRIVVVKAEGYHGDGVLHHLYAMSF